MVITKYIIYMFYVYLKQSYQSIMIMRNYGKYGIRITFFKFIELKLMHELLYQNIIRSENKLINNTNVIIFIIKCCEKYYIVYIQIYTIYNAIYHYNLQINEILYLAGFVYFQLSTVYFFC